MTVIAWDGTTLAADRRAMTEDGHIRTSTKIGRHRDSLWATAGEEPVALEMLAWWMSGAERDKFPSAARNDKASLIVVRPDARVVFYTAGPIPSLIEDEHCAFGCGRDFALMAMRLGKGARGAVLLASEMSAFCGNGVDTLELEA